MIKKQRITVKDWLRDERHLVWLEYGGLSLIILLPLLLPGFILSIDLVFTPHFAWPTELTNTYILQAVLWLLSHILPGDVIEKSILFVILLLSGVGMHTMLRRIKTDDILADMWRMAAYVGGIFYMINPFTYSRFMAGQWMVLLGYALLPWVLLALIRLMARPSWPTALRAGLWMLGVTFVSIHHVGIMALLGLVVVIVAMVKYGNDKKHIGRLLGWMSASAVGVAVVSSFWLVPALIGQNSIGQAVADFNQNDAAAFATSNRGSLGTIGDVVRLQGFWLEGRDLYKLPQDVVPVWGVVFLLIWVLIIVGAVKAWRQHRVFVIIAGGSIIAGIVFASTPIVTWLATIIHPLAGYREPHKFVNLVALGYALLMAFGAGYAAQWMSDRFRERGGQLALIVCSILPFAVTPVMLWGFAGQLSPKSYPPEWYAMNNTLKTTVKAGEKVLFLPWHQYSTYSFSDRLIANPAPKFFQVPIIASDDPEFQGVSSTTPSQEKERITKVLAHPHDLTRVLLDAHTPYILLAKEVDTVDYRYIDKASNLQVISENPKLKLYKIASP